MTVKNANADLRDRLKAVQEELRTKRSERAEAVKDRDAAKEAFAGVEPNGQKITEMPEFSAAEQAVRVVGTIDDTIADLGVAERGILELMGEADDPVKLAEQVVGDLEQFKGWDARRVMGDDSAYRKAVA